MMGSAVFGIQPPSEMPGFKPVHIVGYDDPKEWRFMFEKAHSIPYDHTLEPKQRDDIQRVFMLQTRLHRVRQTPIIKTTPDDKFLYIDLNINVPTALEIIEYLTVQPRREKLKYRECDFTSAIENKYLGIMQVAEQMWTSTPIQPVVMFPR